MADLFADQQIPARAPEARMGDGVRAEVRIDPCEARDIVFAVRLAALRGVDGATIWD